MKKIIHSNIYLLSLLVFMLSFAITACEDKDGSPEIEPGTPVFESITPDIAGGGEMVVLKGSGLGDMRSIVFEKLSVPASLVPTLNTENAIIFRVPADAEGGAQKITFTNSEGKILAVDFNVLAFPQITAASNCNFIEGMQITLTGTNLNDVSKVVFTGTTIEATIVSKVKKQLVISMPAAPSVNRATLDITNVTGTITTTTEFVNIANAFPMFTDNFGPGIENWGWSCAASANGDEFRTGTKSLKAAYDAWGAVSLYVGNDNLYGNFTDAAFLTFWAKGSGASLTINIGVDGPSSTGTLGGSTSVTIPADVWTYFRIPASTFTGQFGRVFFQATAAGTVFFDDLMFIK